MKQETELVSGSPPTFSLPFRVAVKVALPASRISCTYRNKAWLSGERGPHGLVDGSRLFLSKLELTFHHQFKARTCLAHLFPKTSHAEGKCYPTYLYWSQVIRRRHDVLGQGGDPFYLAMPLRRCRGRRAWQWREQRT